MATDRFPASLAEWVETAHEQRDRAITAEEALTAAQERIAVLEAALLDARTYIDAAAFNARNPKTRVNYARCVSRIDAALAAQPGEGK